MEECSRWEKDVLELVEETSVSNMVNWLLNINKEFGCLSWQLASVADSIDFIIEEAELFREHRVNFQDGLTDNAILKYLKTFDMVQGG